MNRNGKTSRRAHAFTLVEALMASAVLAMAITMPFTAAAQNQQEDGRLALAACLAQKMMDEILDKPFHAPNGYVTPGKDRGEFGRAVQIASATFSAANNYATRLTNMNPLSYWRLGETSGTSCSDSRGGNNGWYTNGPVLSQAGALVGSSDKAVRFDGSNDYVNMGTLSVSGNQITMVCWLKPQDSSMNGRTLIAKAENGNGNTLWSLGTVVSGGYGCLHMEVKATGRVAFDASSGNIEPNQWAMAAGVYDGVRLILYKDGVEVGRTNGSGSITQRSGVSVWIGGRPPTDVDEPWKGWIDEAVVFTRALSAAEIAQLYKARQGDITLMAWND